MLILLSLGLVGCTQVGQAQLNPTPTSHPADTEYQLALERYDECMKAAGWTGVDSPIGTIFGAPVEQQDAFLASETACTSESGLSPESVPDVTDAALEDGYNTLLNMRKCLVTNGFDILPAPSFQHFMELSGLWSPYESLSGIEQLQNAEAVCPQDGF